ELLAVGVDPPTRQLEEAHAAELDALARAPRHRVGDDVAEPPLGGRSLRRLHHGVHLPAVVAALLEHALEHLPERDLPAMRPVEIVRVDGLISEAVEEAIHVALVERVSEGAD